MKPKQAAQKLENKKNALAELNEERATAAGSLDALRSKRSDAVKALAKGDQKQRGAIKDLDMEIEALALQLEGLDSLVAEGLDEIQKATTELERVSRDEQMALSRYVTAKLAEEQEAYIADLPNRLKRIFDLEAELSFELGNLAVAPFRYNNPDGNNQIADFISRFQFKLNTMLEEVPAVGIMPSPIYRTINCMIRPTAVLQRGNAERGVAVAEIRRQDLERLKDAFYRQFNEEA